MERFIIDDFQIQIPLDKLTERLCLADEEDVELIRGKLAEALAIACPKALYRICKVDGIKENTVQIEGKEFHSEVLAARLKDVHHVFAYVVTCGTEVDDWSRKEKDYIVNLWLDILKEMILGEARTQFQTALCERYGIPKLSSMGPGSGNLDTWPIAQQKQLFELLENVTEDTGIVLTNSYLMHPTKSVSGVLFPSDKEFVTCSLCKRMNCQNRRQPYKEHSDI